MRTWDIFPPGTTFVEPLTWGKKLSMATTTRLTARRPFKTYIISGSNTKPNWKRRARERKRRMMRRSPGLANARLLNSGFRIRAKGARAWEASAFHAWPLPAILVPNSDLERHMKLDRSDYLNFAKAGLIVAALMGLAFLISVRLPSLDQFTRDIVGLL